MSRHVTERVCSHLCIDHDLLEQSEILCWNLKLGKCCHTDFRFHFKLENQTRFAEIFIRLGLIILDWLPGYWGKTRPKLTFLTNEFEFTVHCIPWILSLNTEEPRKGSHEPTPESWAALRLEQGYFWHANDHPSHYACRLRFRKAFLFRTPLKHMRKSQESQLDLSTCLRATLNQGHGTTKGEKKNNISLKISLI